MAKTKTVTRSGSKTAKNKAKHARNGCCPLIVTSCHDVYAYKKQTVMGDDTAYEKKVKVNLGKKCTVKLGSVVKGKNLSVEAKDAKVKELANALTAKRCLAQEHNVQQAAAQKATISLLKQSVGLKGLSRYR